MQYLKRIGGTSVVHCLLRTARRKGLECVRTNTSSHNYLFHFSFKILGAVIGAREPIAFVQVLCGDSSFLSVELLECTYLRNVYNWHWRYLLKINTKNLVRLRIRSSERVWWIFASLTLFLRKSYLWYFKKSTFEASKTDIEGILFSIV